MLRKARVLVGVNYAYMLEYRAEIILWMLSGILPFILMGVWIKAAGQNDYAGLGPTDFARYFLTVFVVRQIGVVWVIWEFEYHVVQGRLSPYLLQPMDPGWRFFAGHVGERLCRFPFFVGLVALFFFLYPSALHTPDGSVWTDSIARTVAGLAAAVAAFLLRYLMQYTMAMLTFWSERAASAEQVMFLLQMFLSGTVAPLDVYPQALRHMIVYTPFPYMTYFPAMLITGRPVPGIGLGFLVLAGWIVAFFLLSRILWRIGLRHYSGMGA